MPPVHIQQRQIAQSRIPQTGYGTPTVIAANAFQELLLSDQNLAQYSVTTADNTGQSTRVDFPTDQWLLSHDVQRQFEQQLASAPIGRTLYLLNGSVVTTQPAVGTDPNVYQHVFVPQDANVSRQLPSTSIVEQCGSLLDFLYPSAVAESLSLKGEGINRCTASYGMRGSGKRIKPSGVTWATHVNAVAGLAFFFNSVCEVTVADAGTLSNAEPHGANKRLESWSVDYANNLLDADGYRPGSTDFQTPGDVTSGAIRSELLFGSRTLGSGLVSRLAASTDEFAALQSQKNLDVNITLTGPIISHAYAHSLVIRYRLTRYQTVQLQNKNGIVTLAINPKPLWDTVNNEIVRFTLINNIASYTT